MYVFSLTHSISFSIYTHRLRQSRPWHEAGQSRALQQNQLPVASYSSRALNETCTVNHHLHFQSDLSSPPLTCEYDEASTLLMIHLKSKISLPLSQLFIQSIMFSINGEKEIHPAPIKVEQSDFYSKYI